LFQGETAMSRYSFLLLSAALLCPGHAARAGGAAGFVACSMEAMACPGGGYVSRTGPNCEFAPCPSASGGIGAGSPGMESGSGESSEGVAIPSSGSAASGSAIIMNPEDMGLNPYPDEPLADIPEGPQTVDFIIGHRSALNDKQIAVRGVIVATLLGEAACPTNNTFPRMGRPCMQPRITIADTGGDGRDVKKDVNILLSGDDKTTYAVGQTVEMDVTVSGTETDLMLAKHVDGAPPGSGH
jgi:hypothetical protein